MQVKFPRTTPNVGIGWGHQEARGFRFAADIGASLGMAKVSATGRGQLASASGQAAVDLEAEEVRRGSDDLRAMPQLTPSWGHSFWASSPCAAVAAATAQPGL